ncbi:C-type lectin domain family 17, member A-like [Cyprinodon tularosa]|uniref:C-type lectin domain family 17, member A-like n=1 Tax=Cyprinodon tularosa TaxID=77115 RepID=UPI0018E28EA1|nr:C-type lectin domain family 17, member A-like [Cyprinodon tularosa]
MTWTQAQSHCRSHYTDLASVKSSTDNDKIKAIKPAEEAVWLGLFRDQWKWSNGSPLAYTYWVSGQPNGPTESCAATHFDQSGGWVDWKCHETKAFICFHDVPSSNHVVKIKLAGSSTVNLQDAAVQEGLLNQLKEKLQMQGVTADIRLGWKRRRDGNVFYQEKQDDQN